MRRDESGVAGFFEDLPVLMFVLAGTLTILISAINASSAKMLEERNRAIEAIAERSADIVVSELTSEHPGVPVTVHSVCCTGLDSTLRDFLGTRGFCLSMVLVHPEFRWLSPPPEQSHDIPEIAHAASRLINALVDDGRLGVLAVRVVVW